MAVNTGPDINTYAIPEVELSNTFNTWRDISNISSYKLNKLKIYDGLSSGSIDAAVSSAGILSAALNPIITTSHQFSGGISGTTAEFHAFNASGGELFIGTNATGITIGNGGAGSFTRIVSPNVYLTGNLTVGGTATYISSENLSISDTVIVLGACLGIGITGTAQLSKDRGIAFYWGETAGTATATLGFFGFDRSTTNFVYYSQSGNTLGGNEVYAGKTGTFQGNFLGGGATFDTATIAGLSGTTASFLGLVKFASGATFSGGVTLEVGATLSIRSGLQLMRGITGIGFVAPSVLNSNILFVLPGITAAPGKVLGVHADSLSGLSLDWLTQTGVGGGGSGVTGSNREVQYNSLNGICASSKFVFHNDAITISGQGISAGTLGLSGGLYVLGNVGIGITPAAVTGQIILGKSKLQVAGDIRLNGGGFFVNPGMTVGVDATIVSNDNALFVGRLNIASGRVLTVESGASLVVL